jgi:hypothetical protein
MKTTLLPLRLLSHLLILLLIGEIAATETKDPKYVMFVSVPMHGHVNALKPFAQELADRGYRVSFLVCKVSFFLNIVDQLRTLTHGSRILKELHCWMEEMPQSMIRICDRCLNHSRRLLPHFITQLKAF